MTPDLDALRYYKATNPDGLSFRAAPDGQGIDYASALITGAVIRHPSKKKVRNDPSTYISVSVEPADCTGFSWPCRLFRVEPVGRVMGSDDYPNKRAVSALRVVEELPSHLALGPNGETVMALIDGFRALTPDDWREVAAAWYAARDAAWYAARAAARDAAWAAAWAAARYAAWDAARDAARYAAWDAARDAAWAIIVRDLITAQQYDLLTQPFVDAGFAGMVGR